MMPIIILGAGGHAKVVAEILTLTNQEILGYLTPELVPGEVFNNGKILGNDDTIDRYNPLEIELVNGVGSLPNCTIRRRLAKMMRDKGYHFKSVIHPNTIISKDVQMGEGVQIMAGSIIQAGCQIMSDTIVNTGSIVDHDCVLEERCHLAPAVTLSGGVRVGKETHIGTGANVIQGISIGQNCLIAAGASVYKNVESHTTVKHQGRMLMERKEG